MPAHTCSRSARLRVRTEYTPIRSTIASSETRSAGMKRRLVVSWLSPKCTAPMCGSTTGGFSLSSTFRYSSTRGSSICALNGRFEIAVGRPAVSVTITGTPSARMDSERSSSAAFPDSSRGSASARKTRAYICPERPASARSSATTRAGEEHVRAEQQHDQEAEEHDRRAAAHRSADPIGAEIRAQRLRHRHRAVRALVVLEQRDDRARETRARNRSACARSAASRPAAGR